MPETSGLEIIAVLQNLNSEVKIIATTGLTREGRSELAALGVETVLTKPYRDRDVLQALKQLLSAWFL